jgi:uncharacterized membrane protein
VDSSQILDGLGAIASLLYAVTSTTSLVVSGPAHATTLRRLKNGTRLAQAAIGIAVINLAIQAADIPNDGVFWAVLWVGILACAISVEHFARQRRDLKGLQVLADAERTVRDYTPPTRES